MHETTPNAHARRRAVLADLVNSGLPGAAAPALRARLGRRGSLRNIETDPRSDAELRDRIQHRLGRMVSHPRALRVDVDQGVVRLSGRVLVAERQGLLAQLQQMAGVQKLVDAMTAYDLPQEIARGSHRTPAPRAAAD
jgi:hypothetical protein